jgi:diaminopimelate decarboxylase
MSTGTASSLQRSIDRRMGLLEADALDGRAFHGQRTTDATPDLGASGPVPPRLLSDNASIGPDGGLQIAGVDVVDLADRVGTPLFVYDEGHLRSQCREARRVFGDGVAYASKAFLCRAMARLVDQEGMMVDVSSGGELYIALRAGVRPRRLVLHGSNKSVDELTLALIRGVGRIVVDSFDEIELLERLVSEMNPASSPRLLLRVNPGIDAHTHEAMATGREDTKFGLSLASGAAAEAVERLSRCRSPFELVGLHTHIGSQILDMESFALAIRTLAPLMLKAGLGELCIGGGLGVAYAADDEPAPSLGDWAAGLHRAGQAAGLPPSVRLTAEPGRAIAATAAITCYTIGGFKSVAAGAAGRSRTYVSVDGGMGDNLRPALYQSRYEAFLPREASANRPFAATVVGRYCESGDIVVRNGRLPQDVVKGDILATPVTGAYGYAMASNYNRVPKPPVVFVGDGSYRIVTRRETYEDLLQLDMDTPARHTAPSRVRGSGTAC